MTSQPKILKTSDKKCDGIFFRCRVNNYYNEKTKSIEYKTTYKFLKKMSCSGCDTCRAFFFDCREGFDCGIIIIPDNPIDNQIYQAFFKPLNKNKYCEDWLWELKIDDKEISYE